MKLNGFEYSVSVVVEFSGRELAALHKMSTNHYDGICKLASREGGFLYGAINRFCFAAQTPMLMNEDLDKTCPITLDGRELSILCKIAEQENNYAQVGGIPVLGELGKELSRIMHAGIDEWKRLEAEQKRRIDAGRIPATLPQGESAMITIAQRSPHEQMLTFTLPAGRYVLSDPCYVLSDSFYDRLIDAKYAGPNGEDAHVSDNIVANTEHGHLMLMSTYHGDGSYDGFFGDKHIDCPVDSGQLAILPWALVVSDQGNTIAQDTDELPPNSFELTVPLRVMMHEGCIRSGMLSCDTRSDDEDERDVEEDD